MMRTKQGFTLLEILIALAIFTLIAGIVSLSLYSIVNTSGRLKQQGLELAQLQTAQALLSRDLLQIIDRPIIDETGQEQPAVRNLALPNRGIEFTKLDNLSPLANQQQTNLQRVVYFLQGTDLYRQAWPTLDRIGAVAPTQQRMLGNVTQLFIGYVDVNNQVYDYWPLKADDKTLPKAIVFKLWLKNQGLLERTFVIVGRGWQSKDEQS